MELGLYTFGDVADRSAESAARRLRELIEEAELAEQVGLDVFGVGEHHRADFAVSAPAVVLAAVAARTERIRLTSAVSVLSSDDPVRLFQSFATLDLLSNGRAELMAGRGSFIESFPLFGYDLNDYESLFATKLDLLLQLRAEERVTWSGRHRAPLQDIGVYPRPLQSPLPVWIAAGGSPQSFARAGRLGLPLAVAIIGGAYAPFAPLIALYREAAVAAGHDLATLPISINSPTYIADSTEQAVEESYPAFAQLFTRIGRERGWGAMNRSQFLQMRSPQGGIAVGSPQDVIEKILRQHELFGHQRFLAQIGVGPMSHSGIMRAIELFGTVVAPAVRKELGGRAAPARQLVASPA
jgi:probable LLM family oxidoreductase